MQLEVFNAEQMDLLEIYRGRIWDSLPWSTNLPLAWHPLLPVWRGLEYSLLKWVSPISLIVEESYVTIRDADTQIYHNTKQQLDQLGLDIVDKEDLHSMWAIWEDRVL